MASNAQAEIAAAMLEELTSFIERRIKHGGFDNESVIWMIKVWTKIGTRLRGPGFHRQATAYYVMKREPSAASGKRSQVLLRAMDSLETMITAHGITDGDYFRNADRAMLDFVWEYRKHLPAQGGKGNSEQDFVKMLLNWQSQSVEQVMKTVLTNMDRHA